MATRSGLVRITTTSRQRAIEQATIEQTGLDAAVLMEAAGRAAATHALAMLAKSGGKRVLVACGPGNNGGDGLVLARALAGAGCEVAVVQPVPARSPLMQAQLKATHVHGLAVAQRALQSTDLVQQDLIVDALLGIGTNRALDGRLADAVAILNQSEAPVLALDLPSGVFAEMNEADPSCVAARTVCFGAIPSALTQLPARSRAGVIACVEIGIPQKFYTSEDGVWIDSAYARSEAPAAPVRKPAGQGNTHKGTLGHAVVLGGAEGMSGALVLACLGALHSGVGLVTAYPMAADAELPPEVMRLSDLNKLPPRAAALVVGPGMGRSETAKLVVERLLAEPRTLVIDADALNLVSSQREIWTMRPAGSPTVLTPHPLELARLLNVTTDAVQRDRVAAAKRAAEAFGSVVVLKGANTVVASPDGRWFVNSSGSDALARGGTGDVLAGAIGGLCAQGFSPETAACLATYWHGVAGDLAADHVGLFAVTASEVSHQFAVARAMDTFASERVGT